MARFRRKPGIVEAVQWRGDNVDEIRAFLGGLPTMFGTTHVGDWIIKGRRGEFYSVRPESFDDGYEPMPDEAA